MHPGLVMKFCPARFNDFCFVDGFFGIRPIKKKIDRSLVMDILAVSHVSNSADRQVYVVSISYGFRKSKLP